MSIFSASSSAKQNLSAVKWGPLGALFVSAAAVIGGQIVGLLVTTVYVVVTRNIHPVDGITYISSEIPLLFTSYLVAQVVAFFVVVFYIKRRGNALRDLGFRSFGYIKALVTILAASLGFVVLFTLVALALELFLPGLDLSAEQEIGFLDAVTGFELALAFTALVVIAPISEEAVFRGLLLPALYKWTGLIPAVALTSLIFGLLHPPLGAMITIGIFAIFLSWVYVRNDSLWPAILLHSAKNLLAFVIIFYPGA